jgi:hypothetical protein
MLVDTNVKLDAQRLDFREAYGPSVALDWRLTAVPVLEIVSGKLIF